LLKHAAPFPHYEHGRLNTSGVACWMAQQDKNSKALWDVFVQFDANGDGKIQEPEFYKLMHSLGTFNDKEIGRLFQEADHDKSGNVDWKEFIKWICSEKASNVDAALRESVAASLSQMLTTEVNDEANFIEQAAVSKQVTTFLRDVQRTSAETKKANDLKKKQNKAKKIHIRDVSEQLPDSTLDFNLGADYDGPRLPIPITQKAAIGLMNHYLKNGIQKPLHAKFVNHLTTEFTTRYKICYPKPVVQASTPKPGRLIIVGDTHGQLADVLHIFHQLGPPSSQNRYLFNGDIADRGGQAVEIYMLLFSFFLADNSCMLINRGNHENEDMNALDMDDGGGFYDEALSKYGLNAYRRFVSAFKVLSLGAIVEEEIFVVHGGLPRVKSLSLDYINTIDFHEVTAPHPKATNVKDQVFFRPAVE